MRQIALPLGDGPLTPCAMQRIVVGTANSAAIDAFAQAATWPFGTAILFAPPRAGKSLLAGWFAATHLGEAIDDADAMPETELFHRWNRAREASRPLLLTATTRAFAWHVSLPDLGSRLAPALRLDIAAPDDAMLAALIVAHAEARALPLDENAGAYLASRCERSHLAAERLVAAIDRLSLERKSPPGPAIWRQALEEMSGGGAGEALQPRLL